MQTIIFEAGRFILMIGILGTVREYLLYKYATIYSYKQNNFNIIHNRENNEKYFEATNGNVITKM